MTDKEKILQILNDRSICHKELGGNVQILPPDITIEKKITRVYLDFDSAGRFLRITLM